MESYFNKQMEYTLQGSLKEYGLNPREWFLDFSKLRAVRANQNEVSIDGLVVRSRDDHSVAFEGAAIVKTLGEFFKIKWQKMSLNEI